MKQCSYCKKIKELALFSIRASNGQPLSNCKKCEALKKRMARSKNKTVDKDYYKTRLKDDLIMCLKCREYLPRNKHCCRTKRPCL